MEDEQLQLEVDWCLARLEEKLAGLDPYSRPAQEAAKVHRILKSSKAPVIKKRQAMRNTFGDYRAKMKATEKKNLAAMKKSKLMPVTEPPKDSRFFRRGTGAQAAYDVSMKSVTSAADTMSQLSVTAAESQTDSQTTAKTDSGSTEVKSTDLFTSDGDFKFNFDGSERGPDTDSTAAAATSAHVVHQNYFVIKPSNEEFRFNFTVDEES